MCEGNYTVVVSGKSIDVTVTDYIPAIKGMYHLLPKDCYPDEPEDIQYKANTGNEVLDYFLDNYVFEVVDAHICKQLSEKINE